MTSCTRSLSQSLPLDRSSALCPIRPSSTMRSSTLRLSVTVSGVGWASRIGFIPVDILLLLLLGRTDASFGTGLTQQLLILNHFLQQIFEFFVSDKATSQICPAVAQLEQLTDRCDLLSDFSGLKIIHTLET